jgi:hypothetical protein
MGEETGRWGKKLHNYEPHDFNSSHNMVWVTKSTKIRWVEHVTRMRKHINAYVVVVRKGEEKRP